MRSLLLGMAFGFLCLMVWMVFIPIWHWALGFFILAVLFGGFASEV